MEITDKLPLAKSAPKVRRPPGPGRNPLLGLLAYRRGRLGLLQDLAHRYGDICYFNIGPQQTYLLNHPDMIKEVLVTNSQNFIKGPALQRSKQLLGDGLLTSEGRCHQRQRRLAQPAFHQSRIEAYARIMTQFSGRATAGWRDGQTVDLAEEMMALTLAIVGKTLFDADIESEAGEIGEAITGMLQATDTSSLSSIVIDLLKKLPVVRKRSGARAKAKFEHAKAKLDALIYRLIEERRGSGDRGDLLSMMLLAHDEDDGGQMSNVQLRDEAMTIFMTGHETTAVTLAWTFYLLSQHPEIEAKLHAEIADVLRGGVPTMADLKRLPYTEMVLCESMRLYPPAWALQRTALNDCEIGGYVVPKDSQVLMSQYVMHRDPRYFPDPERFDPERWTAQARSSRPQFSYFPFGGGLRRCIGDVFAMMEATLLLTQLAGEWQMRLEPGHEVALQPVMSLRPKYGMRMILKSRVGLVGVVGFFVGWMFLLLNIAIENGERCESLLAQLVTP
jgi:cytochrome P450